MGLSVNAVYDGGSVFRITLEGTLTTLYSFCGESYACDVSNGANPFGGLLQATDGNLYAMTSIDGVTSLNESLGEGAVYRLSVDLGPFVALEMISGAVGAPITILGTDLTGTTSVTFNGVPATFAMNIAGGAITATVPPGATTGLVKVTTRSGVLASNMPFLVIP